MIFANKFLILSRRERRGLARVGWMFLLYSPIATMLLLFIGLAVLNQWRHAQAIERDGIEVTATVTSSRIYRSNWTSRYTFVDTEGGTRFGEASGLSSALPVGSKIVIRYSRSAPWISTHDLGKLKVSSDLAKRPIWLVIFLIFVGPIGLILLINHVRSTVIEPPEAAVRL